MWPFRRKPPFVPPPWSFAPADPVRMDLELRRGEWRITDGGDLDSSEIVRLGTVIGQHAALTITEAEDGFAVITLQFEISPTLHAAADEPACIVIDSGEVVFCSVDAFAEAGIRRGRLYEFGLLSERVCPRTPVKIVRDEKGECVAIMARPPFGDGAYAIGFRGEGGTRTVAITVDESL